MCIFDGTDAIINRILFGSRKQRYHQLAALELLKDGSVDSFDGVGLVGELCEAVEVRWREAVGLTPRRASAQNWRFTLNPQISDRNHSIEKRVEKRIAELAKMGRLCPGEWANQIPVASGLLSPTANKKTLSILVIETSSATSI